MQNTLDKCNRLRKLHSRLTEELRTLKETRSEIEREGFENPLETASIIKGLQATLSAIEQELEKCPPPEE
jgi:hypothetical protein